VQECKQEKTKENFQINSENPLKVRERKFSKMMLENQIISNCDYGYELLDTNLPAIEKLTSATSANISPFKYWNPATDDEDHHFDASNITKFNNATKGEDLGRG
jgi:hypothetical protein